MEIILQSTRHHTKITGSGNKTRETTTATETHSSRKRGECTTWSIKFHVCADLVCATRKANFKISSHMLSALYRAPPMPRRSYISMQSTLCFVCPDLLINDFHRAHVCFEDHQNIIESLLTCQTLNSKMIFVIFFFVSIFRGIYSQLVHRFRFRYCYCCSTNNLSFQNVWVCSYIQYDRSTERLPCVQLTENS